MAQVRTRWVVGVVALVIVAAGGCSSSSKTTASSSSSSSTSAGVTAPAAGNTVNVVVSDTKGTDAPETLVPTPATAKAGSVTFTVKNTGTIDHEVVVLKLDTPFDQLPVGASEPDKVDESSSVGETGDPALKPGETRSFTIDSLTAGNYVLVCNIAKHYALGMRAAFKVT